MPQGRLVPRLVIRMPVSFLVPRRALNPTVRRLLHDVAETISDRDQVHILPPSNRESDTIRTSVEVIRETLENLGVPPGQITVENNGGAKVASLFEPFPPAKSSLVIEVAERLAA